MVNIGISTVQSEVDVARAEAPEFEKVTWYKDRNLRRLYFWCSVLCIASATTGYDGMMLNTVQALNSWETYFKNPAGSKLGFMNATYQIGNLIGFPVVPYMADWWGRRAPIAAGCVLMILGGFIGAFCNGYGMYTAGRFVLGVGNSMAQMSSPVLLTELCHPQHRAKFTAVYNCLWNLGALFVAWIALATMTIKGDWSWRSLALMQAIPAVVQILFIYWVPESPRWLISKERYEEALDILSYYHANGNRNHPTVQFEYREIKETLRLEFEHQRTSTYLDFFKTRGNRYRLMLLIALGVISQYSGNALISNYMNLIYTSMGITSQTQKILLNGGQTCLSLITSVGCALLCDRVGRRPLFLIATTGMACTFLAWTVTSAMYEKSGNIKTTGYPQVAWVWLFSFCYAIAWSGLLVAYALEILPYKLRAKGLMVMNYTVQSALVLGNYTNPIAWVNLPHHYDLSMIYTIWVVVELIFVYFFFVETRGPTLEELAKIFDGENAEVAHVDIAQVEKELHAQGVAIHDEKTGIQTQHSPI
jgi:sugar porter (SP) family MFS transporter